MAVSRDSIVGRATHFISDLIVGVRNGLDGIALRGAPANDADGVIIEPFGDGDNINLTIRAKGSGTVEIAGMVISGDVVTDLPTTDPAVAGQLWVDENGTVKVSAGE